MITDVTLPGSAGFSSYKSNLGETLNKGFDIQFRFDVMKNKDWNVALWGNLNHNRNEILKISDALKAYNSQVEDYYDLLKRVKHQLYHGLRPVRPIRILSNRS